MDPKPIETRYKGYRFRSRLEARWAVFFDSLGMEWEFEKQGYDLPSGRYLPDFWLPTFGRGTWFEVKGVEPTEEEQRLASELATATDRLVYMAVGEIPNPHIAIDVDRKSYWKPISLFAAGESPRGWHAWSSCSTGKHIGIAYLGIASQVRCGCERDSSNHATRMDDRPLVDALRAARSARFEHGEHGDAR